MELKPQKKKGHYFRSKYNNLERFVSYFYQINLVTDLAKDKDKNRILEIGVGSGIISDYLKKSGFNITTCDFDKELGPDVVADIRQLPFNKDSFEIITAFEVLEHLPFEELNSALAEMKKISSKYVVISLPYRSTGFEIVFKFPGLRSLFRKDFVNWFFRIPLKFGGIKVSGQHYWEMDGVNYRLDKIRSVIKKHFKIIKEIRPVLDNYRYFFILEK